MRSILVKSLRMNKRKTAIGFAAVLISAVAGFSHAQANGLGERQSTVAPVAPVQVIQPASATRQVKYLLLPNQLKVLLISDPAAEKSAASMNVDVGSTDDPMDRQGLAHFLEHMLFLGTGKYPKADAYQDFISGHGGDHNAFTSATNTNYFFDINNDALQPALDRFAQFFIDPLFNAAYVGRERNAVNSEYTAKYTDEYRRIRDVYREIAVPGHPLSRFSVGNLETLDVDTPRPLRDDLVAFYQAHYSAHRMSLAVVSNQPMATLENWVAESFTGVPNREVAALSEFESFLSEQNKGTFIRVQPRKDMREISFVFPVPATEKYFAEKPLSYISFFIGHEGEGSLLSLLKAQNWATALGSGNAFNWRGGDAFAVTISLTEAGVDNIAAVEALLFAYVDLLQREGVEKWRFDELKNLGNLAFEYGDKTAPINEVVDLSSSLQLYPPELVLKAANWYGKFDKKLIQRYLKFISPENMLRVLVAPGGEPALESTYYATPYSLEQHDAGGNLLPAEQVLVKKLALPKPNPFIADDFTLLRDSVAPEVPVKVVSSDNVSVWYAQDHTFGVPKAHVKARLLLPPVADSVEGAALARLYAKITAEMLNETAYNAAMAGLSFNVSASSRGIDIDFQGYNDTLDQLVKAVVRDIRKYNRSKKYRAKVHDRVFADARMELLRAYNNMQLDSPYRKLLKNLPAFVFSPYWAPEQLAGALAAMDRASYETAVVSLMSQADLQILVYGNVDKTSARATGKTLANLVKGSRPPAALPSTRVVNMSASKTADRKGRWNSVPVEHADAGAVVYFQGADDSLESNAKTLLLQQLIATPFYGTLRTEKQLGYIVFASSYPIRDVPAIVAVVQSPAVPVSKILGEMDAFLTGFESRVLTNFERDKAAVISVLMEKPKSLAEQAQEYWQAVLTDQDFMRSQKLAKAVEAIQPSDIQKTYSDQLLNKNTRLLLLTPPDAAALLDAFYDEVDSPDKFKKGAVTYDYK